MTLQKKIILTLKKTGYIRIDYTNLSKSRFFIMTTTHPTVSNTITDSITPRIAIFVNLTDKPLEIRKGIRLNIIYKFVKTVYFLTDTFKMATVLAITTIIFSEPLS